MKALIVFGLIVCLIGGCTTLRPVENTPNDLSQHFNDGGILKPGDRVVITTTAGVTHRLSIRAVRDGVIYGDHDSVPFSEIASIYRRDFSPPKTGTLVVVVAVVVGAIAAAVGSAGHPNTGL